MTEFDKLKIEDIDSLLKRIYNHEVNLCNYDELIITNALKFYRDNFWM